MEIHDLSCVEYDDSKLLYNLHIMYIYVNMGIKTFFIMEIPVTDYLSILKS